MPAQPPFFTPTRRPATARSLRLMMSRTRSAALSVSVMTFGLVRRPAISTVPLCLLPHVQRHASLIRHSRMIPGRLEHEVNLYIVDALHRADGVFHPARHVAGDRAAGSGQGHVDG